MGEKKDYIKLSLNVLVPIILMALLLYALPGLLKLLAPFVVGWILSLLVNPIVKVLEKRLKIVRKAGTVVVIILAIALVVLTIYGVLLFVVKEVKELTGDIPALTSSITIQYYKVMNSLHSLYSGLPRALRDPLVNFTDNLGNYITDWASGLDTGSLTKSASGLAGSLPTVLINIIVGLLATYFFIADKVEIDNWLKDHAGEDLKKLLRICKVQLVDVLGGYIKAQLKIMLVIYVILAVYLGFMKAPYFALSALGIAFLDMLPFFGTGTILGPWAIMDFITGDYKRAILLVVLYLLTQLVRQVIQPKLLGDSMGVNPFAMLFIMYLGFLRWGLIGMIVAIPIGMIIINLYRGGLFDKMIYSAKVLYHDFRDYIRINPEK